MITRKQNLLHIFFCAAILMLLFSSGSMNASAASITRDTDSSFKDIAVAQVNSYVNVRSKASTNGKVVGKMKDNTAAVIKKSVKGDGGKWYYISSGSVKGYVKASYFVTGSSAKKVALSTGTSTAKVTASSLRVRQKATTKSSTLTTLSNNTTVPVLKKNVDGSDGRTFSKVKVSAKNKKKSGYVAQSYVNFCVSMKTAVSAKSGSSSSGSSSGNSSGSSSGSSSSTSSTSGSSSLGASIAAKAKTYVGVLPYVWGGTSLTKGADCSGFVQSVYKLYGVNIPRTTSTQSTGGRSISRSKLQKGDLVFYKNGGDSISHVGIYIGNSKIVHEANSKSDCKISNIDYDKPAKYVTYLR
ncbi:MAG: SH3 domain-containing C40 family peptidase [Lachnospiraceae bacterium]|nr:SH3 domain-containing C40 family peptidase [Lachnospiraceae bacterium]